MAFSQEELARLNIAALQKLKARGLLFQQQANNLISKHEAAIATIRTPAITPSSPTLREVAAVDTPLVDISNLNMGSQTLPTRHKSSSAVEVAVSAKNTGEPRTVSIPAQGSTLSAEAKPWPTANYTTERPAGQSWASQEQLALARAEHNSMMSSGGKTSEFNGGRRVTTASAASPHTATPLRARNAEKPAIPAIVQARSPSPVDAARRRSTPRPVPDNYIPPHMRLPAQTEPTVVEPAQADDTQSKSVISKELAPSTAVSAPVPAQTKAEAVEVPTVTAENASKPAASTLEKDKDKDKGKIPAELEPVSAVTKTGSQSMSPNELGTAQKLVAKAQNAIGKLANNNVPEQIGREQAALETKIDKLLYTVAKQQEKIEAQQALIDKKLPNIEHQSPTIATRESNTREQDNMKLLEESIKTCHEFLNDHCDRLIKLESIVEIYRALGTVDTKTPFVVKVEYPDKSLEKIQTFGGMQINRLLERIVRKKNMALDVNKTATLTYLGEQLGHLSFVGEHDIHEDSVLYLARGPT